jgi:hypothetical protein
MEATMTETRWGKKLTLDCQGECGSCEVCRTAKYNRSVTGLTPLEAVGSDAYFAAIFAEAKRATAPELPKELRSKVKAPKVARRALGELHPQLCCYCARTVETGETAWALNLFPAVACAPCIEARHYENREWRDGGYFYRWVPAKIGD